MTSPPDSQLCQQVLECLPTGVFAVDREGKIVFWNAGAERITGYLKQEVLGRLYSEGFLEHSERGDATPDGNMAPLKGRYGHSIPVAPADDSTAQRRRLHSGSGGDLRPTSSIARQNRRQSKLSTVGCLDTLAGTLNHAMIQAHQCTNCPAHLPDRAISGENGRGRGRERRRNIGRKIR